MSWSTAKIKYALAEADSSVTKVARRLDLSVAHVSAVVRHKGDSRRVRDEVLKDILRVEPTASYDDVWGSAA